MGDDGDIMEEGGDEEGGLEEAEEEGINPVMIAVPAVAVLGAVAAYAFMGGKKDKKGEDNGFNADNISLDGFKEGKTEALGAAAIGATGLALIGYSLMSGGTAAPVASGFLATDTGKAVAAATGVALIGGGIHQKDRIAGWFGYGETTEGGSGSSTKTLKDLETAQKEATTKYENKQEEVKELEKKPEADRSEEDNKKLKKMKDEEAELKTKKEKA